jgi:hypothetical protein
MRDAEVKEGKRRSWTRRNEGQLAVAAELSRAGQVVM